MDANLQILIEAVKAIKVERGFNARVEIVHEKWEIGECIASDPEYKKSAKGAGIIIQEISEALEIATSDLYDCIKFFDKFPNGVSTAMETLGKDVSWHKIREEYLGGEKEKKDKEPLFKLSDIEKAFKSYLVNSGSDTHILNQEWNKLKNLL